MFRTQNPRQVKKNNSQRKAVRSRIKLILETLEDRLTPAPAVFGYYDMTLGQGVPSQVPPILTAGGTPLQLFGLSAAELAGINVLDVQNEDNAGYGATYLSSLPQIANAVSAGMVLVIHDRFVSGASTILPNGAGFNIIRDFTDGSNIDVRDNTTLVTNGPGGIIDNNTLDGGNFSSHGYAIDATLPGTAKLILTQGDPTHIVTFAYGYGTGTVIYSTIPLDYYLSQGNNNFSDIYAPNVLAYAATNPFHIPTPPTANPDVYSITRNIGNNPKLIVPTPGVMGNDVDPNGLPLTATLVSTTSHGTLSFRPDGSFSYQPNLYYFGPDTFTYKDNDGLFDSNVTTVTINVTFVDAPPVAVNDGLYLVHPGVPFTLSVPGVLLNDSDPDNDPLTALLVSPVVKGTVILASNGSFTYMPSVNTTGADSFTYTAFDGTAKSNIATVSFHINTAPVAKNQRYNTILNNNISGNLLTSDTDFDHDPITAKLVSTTSHGVLTLLSNGAFSYTPALGYFGIDTFTYRDNDGWEDGNIATVTIRVDRLPVATSDFYSTKKNTPLETFFPGVLSNDSDPDTALFGDVLSAEPVTAPTNGTVTLASNGYFKYIPNPGFVGIDTFTYRANDGMFSGNTATVTINVKATPVALPDTYSTLGTQIIASSSTGVLANDLSPNMNPLSARLISSPSFGTLSLNPDGSFNYIATSSFHGVDSFQYVANDGIYDSDVTLVTLNVFNTNQPPVANNDAYSVASGSPTTIPSRGVLANDTDPDGPASALTATLVTGPKYGSLLLLANGGFVYTPTTNYNGYDSFTYQASDSLALSNVATVNLTVGTPPPPPTNPDQRIVLGQDTGGTLKVFAGETGNALFSITPYGSFTGSIRVAIGDFNGDGVPDIVTAPGAQTGTAIALPVRVFSGVDGSPLSGILGTGIRPYGTTYRGGVEVAVGDINGDGTPDIVTGADTASSTNQVRSFNGSTGSAFTAWYGNFQPYSGTSFGGVRVATGDVNGDGKAEIIVSPGASTPTVKIYNPAKSTLATGLLKSFSAYTTTQAGGVYVSAGDLDGDGKAEVIVGGSSSSPGQVRIFDGNTGNVIRSLSIAGVTGTARVAVGDINGDGKLDLVVGITNGSTSRARVYDALTLTEMFGTSLFNYAPGYTGGLFVAALSKSNGRVVSP